MSDPGLFDISATCDVLTVFPEFTVESPYILPGSLNHEGMRRILGSLGFTVGSIRTHTAQTLIFPVGPGEEQATLFEVTYPRGWSVTDDVSPTIYTGDYNPVRQILDGRGHLRGLLWCGSDKVPVGGELYTRYAVVNGVPLNFSKLPMEQTKDIHGVVIDRTQIDPQRPHVLAPIHVDRRDLIAEAYPGIIGLEGEERSRWIDAHMSRETFFGFVKRDGSAEWLDAHYPDWRDPAAYWPR